MLILMNLRASVAGACLGELVTWRPIEFGVCSFLEKCFYALERICSFLGEKGSGKSRVQEGYLGMGWVPGPGMGAQLTQHQPFSQF